MFGRRRYVGDTMSPERLAGHEGREPASTQDLRRSTDSPATVRRSSATPTDDAHAVGLLADGPRPAVEWVTGLPASWTNEGERLVLLVLACDAFDNVSAPGSDNLARWTGMHRSSVMGILSRLTATTATRPALIEAVRSKGRKRTRYRLRCELSGDAGQFNRPVTPDSWRPELSGDAGRLAAGQPSGHTGRLNPATVAQLSGELSGVAGHALALARVVDPPVVTELQEDVTNAGGRITPDDVQKTLDLLAKSTGISTASCAQAVRDQLGRGWRPEQLVEHVRRLGELQSAERPAAALRSRIERLGTPPPALPPKCSNCDQNRMIESFDGRPMRCPTCHPKRAAS